MVEVVLDMLTSVFALLHGPHIDDLHWRVLNADLVEIFLGA